jgi:hypothetical protein
MTPNAMMNAPIPFRVRVMCISGCPNEAHALIAAGSLRAGAPVKTPSFKDRSADSFE